MAENFEAFNRFQESFFLSKERLGNYTNYEFKLFGYKLLNNISKGFPNLVNILINLKGIGWKGVESPELLKALQGAKFVNNFVRPRVPSFIYFKNLKPEKEPKIKLTKDGYEFDIEIRTEICSILKYDTKTYEYLKFGEKIQTLGLQLNGEFEKKSEIKKIKANAKRK